MPSSQSAHQVQVSFNNFPITTELADSHDHDDMLFLSMLNTGFLGLLHLGEMTISNNPYLRDFPYKTYTAFEGNHVHIAKIVNASDSQLLMAKYIRSPDALFPLHPQLWL